MSHPDPNGPTESAQIEVGEIWEHPITGERATILELPHTNRDGRCVVELTAQMGGRGGGEHCHPAAVERFTVVEGELIVKRDGQVVVLQEGESVTAEAGVWHDWWNEGDRDGRMRAEITPGARIVHLVETMWGLARLGHTDNEGVPHPLQLAVTAREFRDAVVYRSPPVAVQRVFFGVLAPIARWRGYRATYPQISRAILTQPAARPIRR